MQMVFVPKHHAMKAYEKCSYSIHIVDLYRSQWPRNLRHELSSNVGIVGSNSTQGMDVCMCLFCVCIGSGLSMG
jgi:hypothetical protein